jgi:hypothetical protein
MIAGMVPLGCTMSQLMRTNASGVPDTDIPTGNPEVAAPDSSRINALVLISSNLKGSTKHSGAVAILCQHCLQRLYR